MAPKGDLAETQELELKIEGSPYFPRSLVSPARHKAFENTPRQRDLW
jgi:hypothetical protein